MVYKSQSMGSCIIYCMIQVEVVRQCTFMKTILNTTPPKTLYKNKFLYLFFYACIFFLSKLLKEMVAYRDVFWKVSPCLSKATGVIYI